jgi:hypothetical protein
MNKQPATEPPQGGPSFLRPFLLCLALSLALLYGPPGAPPQALATEPTPTYVSELGPAVIVPPGGMVEELPSSGGRAAAPRPWRAGAGLGLAAAAGLMVYAALRLGRAAG